MKKELWFLRIAIVLMGLLIMVMTLFGVPAIMRQSFANWQDLKIMITLVGISLYVTALLFFYILFQAWRLLGYIQTKTAFSVKSVACLKQIKYSAYTMSIIYILGSWLYYKIADVEDAPGIFALVLIAICAAFVVGIFAAVLQNLLESAIEMKSENDLTV